MDTDGIPLAYGLYPGNMLDKQILIPMIRKIRKDYVLEEDGYRIGSEGFKKKSRIYPREISVSTLQGKKKKIRIQEKQVIFYSTKYAEKAKADREAVIHKAEHLISSQAAYNRSTSHGAAKYVKDLTYSTNSGEVLQDAKHIRFFDDEKLIEEEKYDGYYAIVTSELDTEDEKIIKMYRGLWRIEESFRIIKSDLETRPVY